MTSWTNCAARPSPPTSGTICTPASRARIPYVTSRLSDATGPGRRRVSDWMRAVPDQIAPFVPGPWSSLGTDGFGHSDTRAALRRHFHVDAPSIVLRVLTQLVDRAELDESAPGKAVERYRLNDIDAAAPGNTDGSAE